MVHYIYIEGSQVIISESISFLSLKIDFVLAKSADTDENKFQSFLLVWFEVLRPSQQLLSCQDGQFT